MEYYTVTKFITSKNSWSLADFKFQMNLDNDEELAKLLLGLSGYLYCEKYDLYFFNKEYAEKGKKELQGLMTDYINHRKTYKD